MQRKRALYLIGGFLLLCLLLAPGLWRARRQVHETPHVVPPATTTPPPEKPLGEADAHTPEPVAFADDFMRSSDEPGAWKVERGHWRLQTAWDDDPHSNIIDRFQYTNYAQNPFAWVGQSANGAALCTTGQARWEDYTCTVAVHPEQCGAVGVAVNLSDARHGYLARWSAAGDPDVHRGDRLQLLKLDGHRETVLREVRGGYVPGQWYRLATVSSRHGIRILIDGEERLSVPHTAPWHGKVGLYVEGDGHATFDDVTVYGSALKTHLLAENAQETIKSTFMEKTSFMRDDDGMRRWADPRNEWSYRANGMSTLKHECYRDHWMMVKLAPGDYGTLTMVLNNNGTTRTSGCQALIETHAGDDPTRFTLYRDGAELAHATGTALRGGEDYTLRFRRAGTLLTLECDGDIVVKANDPRPVDGHFPAYAVTGNYTARSVCVLGSQFLDYTFTKAPVDWRSQGTWLPTMRWACLPKWSFYSGWSRGDAVLWHKRRFSGDQSLQAYLAFKMEYPRETNFYDQRTRYHDACLSICTDGHDPRSGYAIASGLPNASGQPNARTVLYRNGVVVQESGISISGWAGNHFSWYDMELRKHGSLVEFLLGGHTVISYRDPSPIDGGVPAIWTSDNGLCIARARLHYAGASSLNRDPRVYLDAPWFPEWTEVGMPVTLAFPHAFSTTGQPVTLQVRRRQAPANARGPVAAGTRVSFTPSVPGKYWYQITATDGRHVSPPYDLFLQAFNPAAGRDDTHALLLYRFDERAGSVVHDRSRVAPAVDLHIPRDAATCWLPTQGLTYHGRTPIRSQSSLRKLAALKAHRAATIELWVSTDTSHPTEGWLGALLSWERAAGQRNFLVGIHTNTFILAPPGGQFDPNTRIRNYPLIHGSFNCYGARTGLQHLVLTWDGTTTRAYANGVRIGMATTSWQPERWELDAPLLLGNQSDGERTYLGAYYLLAIHDRCLPDAQVRRHYAAGPAAR